MLLSLRLWLGKKLFGVIGDPGYPTGILISPGRVVKWPCEAPELEGHRFAAANTTIPIPKIYRTHDRYGRLAIEMEFVKGCKTLHASWRDLSDEEKRVIVHDVASYIRQLRAIRPPNNYGISSTKGGPCRDIRIGSVKLFGPFDDSDAFHQCVRGGIILDSTHKVFGEEVLRAHGRRYTTRFTHGDLGVQNILIKDGKIAAIIDWECAGWYPEYWKYTKAHYNRVLLPEFYAMLSQQIKRYDDELACERKLWKE